MRHFLLSIFTFLFWTYGAVYGEESGRYPKHPRGFGSNERYDGPPHPGSYMSYLNPGSFQPSTASPTTAKNLPKNAETCPCVLKPGTNECMMYDPRYMASTVEEAILYFPDLQIHQAVNSQVGTTAVPVQPAESGEKSIRINEIEPMPPPPAPDSIQMPPSPVDNTVATFPSGPEMDSTAKYNGSVSKTRVGSGSNSSQISPSLCDSDPECVECSALLLNRLGATGLLQADELDRVSKKFGVEAPMRQKISHSNCQKYHLSQSALEYSVSGYSNGSAGAAKIVVNGSGDPELDALVQQLREKGEKRWQEKQLKEKQAGMAGPGQFRKKRQANLTTALNNLGQQFKIDCTKRGEPVEQGSNWIGLCNVCWAWRKLPATYFPQYVNELVCDADTKCMSGFGSCQQRYKSVDILQNAGTDASPVWKQVTISVANYCDCEVESGSSLHNFVAA